MDTYVHRSAKILPKLFDEYERLEKQHPDRARVIEEPIKMLENWDGYSNINSEGASLYFIFDEFVHHVDGTVSLDCDILSNSVACS